MKLLAAAPMFGMMLTYFFNTKDLAVLSVKPVGSQPVLQALPMKTLCNIQHVDRFVVVCFHSDLDNFTDTGIVQRLCCRQVKKRV